MGWLSTDVLGGDAPRECLSRLETALGVRDLYPLGGWDDQTRTRVRNVLEAAGLDAAAEVASDEPYGTQVTAVVAMASGITMDEPFRLRAIAAGQDDSWAARDPQRAASINQYISALESYAGRVSVLHHPTMFERLAS